MKPVLRALAGLAFAAGLAACQPQEGPCPYVRTMAPLQSVVKFAPGAPQTPENVMYEVALEGIGLKCEYDDLKGSVNTQATAQLKGTMQVTAKLRFAVVRGPAAAGQRVTIPFFVAVTDVRETILNREVYDVTADMPSEVGNVRRVEEQTWMLFDLQDTTGLAFTIWPGLELTPEEVEFNKRRLAGASG